MTSWTCHGCGAPDPFDCDDDCPAWAETLGEVDDDCLCETRVSADGALIVMRHSKCQWHLPTRLDVQS